MRDKQIRHLPVLDRAQVVGILSDRDILRGYNRNLGSRRAARPPLRGAIESTVASIMTKPVRTVFPTTPLAKAAQRLIQSRIGALPVMEPDELVGMLTESDLLRAFVIACEN